jgi:hypothetical protein
MFTFIDYTVKKEMLQIILHNVVKNKLSFFNVFISVIKAPAVSVYSNHPLLFISDVMTINLYNLIRLFEHK